MNGHASMDHLGDMREGRGMYLVLDCTW